MARGSGSTPSSSFEDVVASAISTFGAEVMPKLRAAATNREDQLRGPLENLLQSVGASLSLRVVPVGEQVIPNGARPDYLIRAAGAAVGHVELKAPGRKIDPAQWSTASHDRKQWERIKALPNLLYTTGLQWRLFHAGVPSGDIVTLVGDDLTTAGSKLRPADDRLARLLHEFLHWEPPAPRNLRQLVNAVAGMCRLLRAEVAERLRQERTGERSAWFSNLAADWRRLLFPDSSDEAFADQYAQTVTFALLLARVEGIAFEGRDIPGIARQLGKKHSLMGRALTLLTEDVALDLAYVLESMLRVIGVVDWSKLDDGSGSSYLHLYERFLEVYDPELRKRTGSYYTPNEIVSFMVRFTEEVLQSRLDIDDGFASDQVVVVDPAMGTGTFLLNIVDRVAATAAKDGLGVVSERLQALTKRLIGFEKQTGPYAVAELRSYQALLNNYATEVPENGLRFYVADTLDDPYREPDLLGSTYEPIARSLRAANKVKREEPVVVVIGNPPYGRHAKSQGKWITNGTPKAPGTMPLEGLLPEGMELIVETRVPEGVPPLVAFMPENIRASIGAHLKHLHNLYVYFWRWATWKVFDAHPQAPSGIVAFITTSGYLSGPGFAGMREYLRKTTDEGWIIDLTPEGHRPDVATRIFSGVQHPLCIAVFMRKGPEKQDVPANIRYRSVVGKQREKFAKLAAISPDDPGWMDCPSTGGGFLLPMRNAAWTTFPALDDLLPWSSPGVKANRTWVIAPTAEILHARWQRLVKADPTTKSILFKETRDANLDTVRDSILTPGVRLPSFRSDPGKEPYIQRYGIRSFDVQHVIADARLLNDPRPDLWWVRSDQQVFVSEYHRDAVVGGPGITFTAYVPDMHHYRGSGGGRALPLYRDATVDAPNIAPNLLSLLKERLGFDVAAEDVLAYIAAIVAHPAYTNHFANELENPGVRVPITTDRDMWREAVILGGEVIWLHTRGERYAHAGSGRAKRFPKMPDALRPKCEIPIAGTADAMPDTITFDSASSTLYVGAGRIRPVSQAVWAYNVSGMQVVKKWFGYRKRNPIGRHSSPLNSINTDVWLSEYTTDLLNLLNQLGRLVALEPAQADLLIRICRSPMVTVDDLVAMSVSPVPTHTRRSLRSKIGAQIELGFD